MRAITGIFSTLESGQCAVERLRRIVPPDRINVLTPESTEQEIHSVPTTEDMPPVGAPMGATLGTAVGVATAAFLVPGVGQVVGFGAAAAALAALGGFAGWKAGDAADRALSGGLPADEIYLYEDALRQGRTVVIALVDDAEREPLVRDMLVACGAESIDAARERWWLGLRDAEEESYDVAGHAFRDDERLYRIGFTAALSTNGRSSPENLPVWHHLDQRERDVVRRAFERGRAYAERTRASHGND